MEATNRFLGFVLFVDVAEMWPREFALLCSLRDTHSLGHRIQTEKNNYKERHDGIDVDVDVDVVTVLCHFGFGQS